jgi:hypothetical protein
MDDEDEQSAPKRRVLQWPQMNRGPSHISGTPANTPTRYSSGTCNHNISNDESLFGLTAVPTTGERFTTPGNIGGSSGEDGNHQPFPPQQPSSTTSQYPSTSGAPMSAGMRPRAPPSPPSLPKPRRQVDPSSFTLTPIPQGDVLRGLAPPEEPRSLKDKVAIVATIIGRPFTKAEMNWIMATLWPDTVDYLGKGQKKRGQAVRSPIYKDDYANYPRRTPCPSTRAR